jgi:dolichol-phosphate mannosyltransferase
MQATFQITARRFTRQLRFGLVGVSGIVVNSVILAMLVHGFRIAVPLASMIATEAAIGSNFLLNDRWTFAVSVPGRPLAQRFLRFNGVALGGMAITAAVLTLLTHYAQLNLLIANGVAVGAATIWNYVVNSRWTWAGQTTDHRPPTADLTTLNHGPSSVVGCRSSVVDEEVAL